MKYPNMHYIAFHINPDTCMEKPLNDNTTNILCTMQWNVISVVTENMHFIGTFFPFFQSLYHKDTIYNKKDN